MFGASFYFPLSLAIQEGNRSSTPSRPIRTPRASSELADRLTFSARLVPGQARQGDRDPGSRGRLSAVSRCEVQLVDRVRSGLAHGRRARGRESVLLADPARVRRRRPSGHAGQLSAADRKFKAQYINTGGIQDEGYDIQVDWGIGNFNVNFQTSFLDLYSVSPFPGAAFIDYTGTTHNSSFDYRFFSTVRWGKGPMSVGAAHAVSSVAQASFRVPHLPCSASTRTSSSISSAAGTSSSAGSCAAASTTYSTRIPSGSADDHRTTRSERRTRITIRSVVVFPRSARSGCDGRRRELANRHCLKSRPRRPLGLRGAGSALADRSLDLRRRLCRAYRRSGAARPRPRGGPLRSARRAPRSARASSSASRLCPSAVSMSRATVVSSFRDSPSSDFARAEPCVQLR